jgi:hypothetical protein
LNSQADVVASSSVAMEVQPMLAGVGSFQVLSDQIESQQSSLAGLNNWLDRGRWINRMPLSARVILTKTDGQTLINRGWLRSGQWR